MATKRKKRKAKVLWTKCLVFNGKSQATITAYPNKTSIVSEYGQVSTFSQSLQDDIAMGGWENAFFYLFGRDAYNFSQDAHIGDCP